MSKNTGTTATQRISVEVDKILAGLRYLTSTQLYAWGKKNLGVDTPTMYGADWMRRKLGYMATARVRPLGESEKHNLMMLETPSVLKAAREETERQAAKMLINNNNNDNGGGAVTKKTTAEKRSRKALPTPAPVRGRRSKYGDNAKIVVLDFGKKRVKPEEIALFRTLGTVAAWRAAGRDMRNLSYNVKKGILAVA